MLHKAMRATECLLTWAFLLFFAAPCLAICSLVCILLRDMTWRCYWSSFKHYLMRGSLFDDSETQTQGQQ